VRNRLVRLAAIVAAVALLVPPARSGASFTAQHLTAGNSVGTDSVRNYLRLYSQGSDPAGLTGYAVKSLSSPAVPAATGVDGSLTAQLGGWKNSGTMNRVLTLEARSAITVTASLSPAAGTPVASALIADIGSAGGATSVTLAAGQKRQVNLGLVKFGGNNVLYRPVLMLNVTYAGYSGDFLSYAVPMTVWDGNGAGP
jgi:hypothetical protein